MPVDWLGHFHFLRPWWGLLLTMPALALLLQWRQRAGGDRLDHIIAPHLLEALRLRQFRNRLVSPVSAAALLMLLMTAVAMGPSWRQQPSPLSRDEAALVVLLDASSSMEQDDVQPSRLARARQKLFDLFELRAGTRNALVVFSGSAHTVLGLTDDRDILTQYLAAIDPAIMPRSGKFPERALPLVDTVVGDSEAPTTVLLVTDGLSGSSRELFDDYFGERPHQLLVWGIGSEGSEIPLERDALRALASGAGGRYIPLTVDREDVESVARRIDAHYVITEDSAVPWQDGGYWLVFPCIALFSLWFRRGWTLQWGLAALLLANALQPASALAAEEESTGGSIASRFAGLWLTPDQHGRWLLERGDYAGAAEHFEDPHWKGVAFYYAEEFDLAAEYFSRIDTPAGRFNRANALAQGERYLDALEQYDEVLQMDPEFMAAIENRRQVQELVDAINMMSESQQSETPGTELGEDDPRRADGADEVQFTQQQREQFTAEQVLQDEKISEMWMRSVQRDPSHFLAIKFSMQIEQRRGQPSAPERQP